MHEGSSTQSDQAIGGRNHLGLTLRMKAAQRERWVNSNYR